MVPKMVFFTKGVGKHKEKLQSFEAALRSAGIEQCNIVPVSSIFPPGCRIVSKEKGLQYIKPGQITFCVLARNCTNEPNRLVAASIGLAVPGENTYGYLSEHHSFGETEKKVDDYTEDLAATMLATTLGIEFDPEKSWDERKQEYVSSGKIIKTRSTTQSSEGDKDGAWTTVVAAAVFIMEESILAVQNAANQAAAPMEQKPAEVPAGDASNNQAVSVKPESSIVAK